MKQWFNKKNYCDLSDKTVIFETMIHPFLLKKIILKNNRYNKKIKEKT